MAFPLNELKILRIIKAYFDALKEAGSDIDELFEFFFDEEDISDQDRNAFKDIIINDKIQYLTSYNDVSVEAPNMVCIMDQEIQHSDFQVIGDKLDHDTIVNEAGKTVESDNYGKIEHGVYTLNVITKSIKLTRMIGLFSKFILEHYSTNQGEKAFLDMEISSDRFSPDAEYFPQTLYHVHLIIRFKYIESWPQFYGKIQGILMTACNEVTKYITEPIDLEISLDAKARTKESGEKS